MSESVEWPTLKLHSCDPMFTPQQVSLPQVSWVWQSLRKALKHDSIASKDLQIWMEIKIMLCFNFLFLFIFKPASDIGDSTNHPFEVNKIFQTCLWAMKEHISRQIPFSLEIIFKMWLREAFLTEAFQNWNNLSSQLSSLMASCLWRRKGRKCCAFYLGWYDTLPGVVLEANLKAKLSCFILTVFLPLEE